MYVDLSKKTTMVNLVTIAIASYNNAPYIERCIDSVIAQTYSNLEILIVDDGSKDDSLAKIEKYKADERVRVMSKENGGLSSVRQMALENATGQYISFIDADDYLSPTYVERLLNKLLVDNSDICLCSTRFEDMEGNYLPKESKELSCVETKSPITVTTEALSDPNEHLTDQFYLSDSWDKMYKMSFLRKSGVIFNMPKGYNGSDMVFNRRLALYCPVYSKIGTEEYIHVIYKSSAVHRKKKDLLKTYSFVTEQMLGDINNMGNEAQLKGRITVFYYWGLYLACKDVYQEGGKECRMTFRAMKKRHKVFVNDNNLKMPHNVRSKVLNSFAFTFENLHPFLSLYFRLSGEVFHW